MGQKKRIAVVPGDGIGKEVIPQAIRVIQATGAAVELRYFDWGADRYLADGVTVPPDAFTMLARDFDAILVGAIGDPRVPPTSCQRNSAGHALQDGSLCQRASRGLLDASLCPLKNVEPKDVDFVVIRENTEGVYVDVGGCSSRELLTKLLSRRT